MFIALNRFDIKVRLKNFLESINKAINQIDFSMNDCFLLDILVIGMHMLHLFIVQFV